MVASPTGSDFLKYLSEGIPYFRAYVECNHILNACQHRRSTSRQMWKHFFRAWEGLNETISSTKHQVKEKKHTLRTREGPTLPRLGLDIALFLPWISFTSPMCVVVALNNLLCIHHIKITSLHKTMLFIFKETNLFWSPGKQAQNLVCSPSRQNTCYGRVTSPYTFLPPLFAWLRQSNVKRHLDSTTNQSLDSCKANYLN